MLSKQINFLIEELADYGLSAKIDSVEAKFFNVDTGDDEIS